MSGTGRQGAATVVASLAAAIPLAPLTEDRTYLLLGLVLVLLSALIGALLRRVGASEALVRLAQLVPVALVPWLVPEARDPLRLYIDTSAYVQAAFAPMSFQIGFALFCALLMWGLYLLLETLAIGLTSPGWTFPVLVLPYLIPTLAIYSESNPLLFAFPAAGYALILATATRNGLGGAPGTHDATTTGWRRGVLTTATLSTVLALTGALLFSLPIPERSGFASGGGGPGAVQLGDPSLDLIRNINSPSDRTVITYRTSDNAGEYLRLAALPVFDTSGFHLTGTYLVPLQFGSETPDVALPGTVRTTVQIGEFDAEYLPMPWFPVLAEVAGGNWRYDPATLAVVAVGKGRETATHGLSYETVTARFPAENALLTSLGKAGDPGDDGLTLQLPGDLSPSIRELARSVVAQSGASQDGARIKALADFLRSDAFTYSTSVSPGTTLGTLDDFLLGSRTGYCEQFAGSLAVMARVLGIPSRVVVGFLPGRRTGDHWEVSARNMHAWVEVYFGPDVGWVPVDPTPGGAVGSTASATHTASATPTTASAKPTVATAAPTVAPPLPINTGSGDDSSGGWGWAAGVLVLGGLVAAGPGLARTALRHARLGSAGDPRRASENAWSEVRATARDRGRSWPVGTTRQVAAELGPELDDEGRAALTTLAVTVERARYDRDPVAAVDLRAQVGEISRAMAEAVGIAHRREVVATVTVAGLRISRRASANPRSSEAVVLVATPALFHAAHEL